MQNSMLFCLYCNCVRPFKGFSSWTCTTCGNRADSDLYLCGEKLWNKMSSSEQESMLDKLYDKNPDLRPHQYRKKCNHCGKVFSFSNLDLYRNKKNAKLAAEKDKSALWDVLGGNNVSADINLNARDQLKSSIIDYNQCPDCHSKDLSDISEEEYSLAISKKQNEGKASPADLLLKYKQLLDMGAITQEEYDVKKKQLLEL